jgi:four helix bundle protein
MMSHERLDVYQLAIKFLVVARRIISKLPKGNADLADHLKRASRAVPLLIAEGVGKRTNAHKAKYFADARGEAFECAACLDVMRQEDLVEPPDYSEGKALLEREVSMLTRMCR